MRQNRVAEAGRYAYRRHRHCNGRLNAWHITASNTKLLIIVCACLAGWERLGQFKIRPKSIHILLASPAVSWSMAWNASTDKTDSLAFWEEFRFLLREYDMLVMTNISRFFTIKICACRRLEISNGKGGILFVLSYLARLLFVLSLSRTFTFEVSTTVDYRPHILCAQNKGELFLKQ